MFSNVLKVIELLIKTLASTPDKKREKLAKDLVRVYEAIVDVAARGRKILDLRPRRLGNRGIEIALLSKQIAALDELTSALTEGKLSLILKVYLPSASEQLRFVTDLKGGRVKFSLEQLVSEGELLTREAWVAEMEEKWGMSIKTIKRQAKSGKKKSVVDFFATPEEIEKGSAILDQLEAAGELLRKFLKGKVKLEDLL